MLFIFWVERIDWSSFKIATRHFRFGKTCKKRVWSNKWVRFWLWNNACMMAVQVMYKKKATTHKHILKQDTCSYIYLLSTCFVRGDVWGTFYIFFFFIFYKLKYTNYYASESVSLHRTLLFFGIESLFILLDSQCVGTLRARKVKKSYIRGLF